MSGVFLFVGRQGSLLGCHVVCGTIEDMSEHIKKEHNKTLLLYHLVCSVKYRRKALIYGVPETIKKVCKGIEERYEIYFVEIGTDLDHVHFLIQSIPTMSPSNIAQIVKSITAREIFRQHPGVKTVLWGGKFWSSSYYLNTVGAYANEQIIQQYVKKQGKTYHQMHRATQLKMFE